MHAPWQLGYEGWLVSGPKMEQVAGSHDIKSILKLPIRSGL